MKQRPVIILIPELGMGSDMDSAHGEEKYIFENPSSPCSVVTRIHASTTTTTELGTLTTTLKWKVHHLGMKSPKPVGNNNDGYMNEQSSYENLQNNANHDEIPLSPRGIQKMSSRTVYRRSRSRRAAKRTGRSKDRRHVQDKIGRSMAPSPRGRGMDIGQADIDALRQEQKQQLQDHEDQIAAGNAAQAASARGGDGGAEEFGEFTPGKEEDYAEEEMASSSMLLIRHRSRSRGPVHRGRRLIRLNSYHHRSAAPSPRAPSVAPGSAVRTPGGSRLTLTLLSPRAMGVPESVLSPSSAFCQLSIVDTLVSPRGTHGVEMSERKRRSGLAGGVNGHGGQRDSFHDMSKSLRAAALQASGDSNRGSASLSSNPRQSQKRVSFQPFGGGS